MKIVGDEFKPGIPQIQVGNIAIVCVVLLSKIRYIVAAHFQD
jgi:hypothetical protein